MLRGSMALREAMEGFASADTPIPHSVACRLFLSCCGLKASNTVVDYLVRAGSKGFTLQGSETLWTASGSNPDGDYYTLRVQSAQMKFAVDRLVDLGNGLY